MFSLQVIIICNLNDLMICGCLSFYLSNCPSVHRSEDSFACIYVCIHIRLHVCLYLCLSIHLSISINLSIYIFFLIFSIFSISIYLRIDIYISITIYLCFYFSRIKSYLSLFIYQSTCSSILLLVFSNSLMRQQINLLYSLFLHLFTQYLVTSFTNS